MGGKQASETLLSIKLQQMSEKGGQEITKEQQEKLLREISARYEAELDPLFAAAPALGGGIIDRPIPGRIILPGDRNGLE